MIQERLFLPNPSTVCISTSHSDPPVSCSEFLLLCCIHTKCELDYSSGVITEKINANTQIDCYQDEVILVHFYSVYLDEITGKSVYLGSLEVAVIQSQFQEKGGDEIH